MYSGASSHQLRGRVPVIAGVPLPNHPEQGSTSRPRTKPFGVGDQLRRAERSERGRGFGGVPRHYSRAGRVGRVYARDTGSPACRSEQEGVCKPPRGLFAKESGGKRGGGSGRAI